MLLVVVVTEGPVHTLEESAAAEQAKRKKVSLEEVDVKTGEENEYNVFQVTQLSGLLVIMYSFNCIVIGTCSGASRGCLLVHGVPHFFFPTLLN